MADAPADFMDEMVSQIVALKITIRKTLAKSKLSQNRTPRDLGGTIDGLRQSGQHALADRMEHLDR